MALIPTGKFAQLGYVTRNLEKALAVYRERHDIADFFLLLPKPGTVGPRVGLAYRGDSMIEIIEPAAGAEGVYGDAIPDEDGTVRLHHIAYVIDDFDDITEIVREYERRGYSVPVNRDTGQGVYLVYVDTREELGHYLEFLYLDEVGRDMFARVPVN